MYVTKILNSVYTFFDQQVGPRGRDKGHIKLQSFLSVKPESETVIELTGVGKSFKWNSNGECLPILSERLGYTVCHHVHVDINKHTCSESLRRHCSHVTHYVLRSLLGSSKSSRQKKCWHVVLVVQLVRGSVIHPLSLKWIVWFLRIMSAFLQ